MFGGVSLLIPGVYVCTHVPVHVHVCAPVLATDSISSTVLGLFMSLDSLGLVWGRDVSQGSCEFCPSVHLFGAKSFMVLNYNSYSCICS